MRLFLLNSSQVSTTPALKESMVKKYRITQEIFYKKGINLLDIFSTYENPVDCFNLFASLFFFLIFFFLMIFFKLASGNKCYSKMNKLHFKLYFPYLLSTLIYYFTLNTELSFSFISLFIGSFIYFSMHYVYLFALVGLSKKSISMNVLMEAKLVSDSYLELNTSNLVNKLNDSHVSLEFIREDRLKQMILLGWATPVENEFHITAKGSTFNKIGNFILKTWNLERQ